MGNLRPTPTLTPVPPSERTPILDVLRGVALLGVLIANAAHHYSGRRFAGDEATEWYDIAAEYLVEVLVSGKCVTLLTLLFGLGFAMQAARAAGQGHNAHVLHLRRLAALFVIGVLHATLLWWGDVTWSYALTGFVLLLFMRSSQHALVIWAVALTILPQVLALQPFVGDAVARVLPPPADPPAFRAEFVATIRGDDYLAILGVHGRQLLAFLARTVVWFYPWLLARFLLGALAARRRIFEDDGVRRLAWFRRALVPALVVGALFTGLQLGLRSDAMHALSSTKPGKLAVIFTGELAVFGVVTFYVCTLVLLIQRPAWRRVLMLLAPAGRIPLTTYLMQSLLCTFVFYGWGLGLSGRTGAAGVLAVSLLLCGFQIAFSHLWLARFRHGPMEWLWRTLAYGRPPRG